MYNFMVLLLQKRHVHERRTCERIDVRRGCVLGAGAVSRIVSASENDARFRFEKRKFEFRHSVK